MSTPLNDQTHDQTHDQTRDRSRRRGTHPVNVSHLVVGLVFLGIAGSWALREAGLVDAGEARWALPLILVLAGLVGVVATVARGFCREAQPSGSDEPGEPGATDPDQDRAR